MATLTITRMELTPSENPTNLEVTFRVTAAGRFLETSVSIALSLLVGLTREQRLLAVWRLARDKVRRQRLMLDDAEVSVGLVYTPPPGEE